MIRTTSRPAILPASLVAWRCESLKYAGTVITAWRFATWPTRRSPSLVNPTTDGVTRPPSALGMTTGSPPSITATTELVVPRSIPMIFSAMTTTPYHAGDEHTASLVAQAFGVLPNDDKRPHGR